MARRRRPLALAVLACALIAAAAPSAADAAILKPYGRNCTQAHGVRFCTGLPVPSFDGVPLDVDVTLPATGNGPFPTIAMLHPLGATKRHFFATTPEALGPDRRRSLEWHYNNNFYARRGYAVITYSARGFGGSCGTQSSRRDHRCSAGWTHFADQRYEARDTQHLLGRLVDEGIARADRLGVTGVSYGAAQTLELALLRDRVRLADGSFARWTSPAGTPLRIAAAYARHGFHDAVDMLMPNGRITDFRRWTPRTSRAPLGISQDRNTAMIRAAAQTGFVAPRGTDLSADIGTWTDRLLAGDPFGRDVAAFAAELSVFHGASGLRGRAAPLLVENGWQDGIVPARHAVTLYRRLRAADRDAPVRLQLGDIGHAPAARTGYAGYALSDRGAAFLDGWLVAGREPPGARVVAYPLTCPDPEAPVRPFAARDWRRLHPGAVVLRARGGRVRQGARTGPPPPPSEGSESHACEYEPGSVRGPGVTLRAWRLGGVTLLGGPIVRAEVRGRRAGGRLVAALYAVDRRRRARQLGSTVVRLDGSRELVFQLSPIAYRLARGSTVAIALGGAVPGHVSASNRPVNMRIRRLTLELPVRERPNGRRIVAPSTR